MNREIAINALIEHVKCGATSSVWNIEGNTCQVHCIQHPDGAWFSSLAIGDKVSNTGSRTHIKTILKQWREGSREIKGGLLIRKYQ